MNTAMFQTFPVGHLHDNTAHTPNVHWPTHVTFENHLWRHVGWEKPREGGKEQRGDREDEGGYYNMV